MVQSVNLFRVEHPKLRDLLCPIPGNRLKITAEIALVASGHFLINHKKERFAFAVETEFLHRLRMSRGLSFFHQLILGATEKVDKTGFESRLEGDVIQIAEGQHLRSNRVLNDRGHQACGGIEMDQRFYL